MVKNFSLFLALRYLQPKRSFVSVITAISITGVMLGVAVLLVVIAVMAGFEDEFKKQLLEFEPHIILKPNPELAGAEDDEGWGEPMTDPDNPFGEAELAAQVPPPDEAMYPSDPADFQPTVAKNWQDVRKDMMAAFPDIVLHCSPFIDARVVLGSQNPYSGELKEACALFGVDKNDEYQVEKLGRLVTYGTFDLSGSNIVISKRLADLLQVGLNDSVDVYVPKMFDRILEILQEVKDENSSEPTEEIAGLEEFRGLLDDLDPSASTEASRQAIVEAYEKTQEALRDRGVKSFRDKVNEVDLENTLKVVGIFESPQHDGFAFMPLDVAQRMMFDGFSDTVDGLQIITPDAFRAEESRQAILNNLDYTWTAQTWMDRWQGWLDILSSERSMMFFVLMFIMIVAAFSIMNTMITVAVQKRREIGMMRALGSKTSQIIAIFLYKGVIVGFIGTILGLVVGLAVLYFRNDIREVAALRLGLEIFPASTFGIAKIPMRLESSIVFLICFTAFLLSAVAAIIPAWGVTRLDPAKALRNA
ncbi:MAG: FtsX-like permease family protein [Verrucomicrobiales bacterium]